MCLLRCKTSTASHWAVSLATCNAPFIVALGSVWLQANSGPNSNGCQVSVLLYRPCFDKLHGDNTCVCVGLYLLQSFFGLQLSPLLRLMLGPPPLPHVHVQCSAMQCAPCLLYTAAIRINIQRCMPVAPQHVLLHTNAHWPCSMALPPPLLCSPPPQFFITCAKCEWLVSCVHWCPFIQKYVPC